MPLLFKRSIRSEVWFCQRVLFNLVKVLVFVNFLIVGYCGRDFNIICDI